MFQVRANLHVVLCFSPVGDTLRVRARQFPAIVNCTACNWMHPWPAEVRQKGVVHLSAPIYKDMSAEL